MEDISITVAYKANFKSRGKVHRKLIFNEFLSFFLFMTKIVTSRYGSIDN